MGDNVLHPYKTIGRMIVLAVLIITALKTDIPTILKSKVASIPQI
jgi:hypothetical protein